MRGRQSEKERVKERERESERDRERDFGLFLCDGDFYCLKFKLSFFI